MYIFSKMLSFRTNIFEKEQSFLLRGLQILLIKHNIL
jgi:hypothetical protein